METLDQRYVLATDLFVGPLVSIPDSIDAQTANPPSLASEAATATGEDEAAVGEGEAEFGKGVRNRL
jgi:hypothetical protein